MENIEETDNITKNIVQEILRECAHLNIDLETNFCAYYVKLLTLDPVWKISPERKLNRENIQRLVTFIIEKTEKADSPGLITMKIQQYFLAHIQAKEYLIESHRQQIREHLEPLLDFIINFNNDEDANKALEHKFLKRIVLYIVINSGIGNPKHPTVIKEATVALRSIFDDETELQNFIDLKPEEKMAQLIAFQNVVTGIRLFNRDNGKQTSDIEDLPKILSQSLAAVHSELQTELLRIMEKVNLTTSAIESVFVRQEVCKTRSSLNNICKKIQFTMDLKLPEDLCEETVHHTLAILALSRQHEVYIRKLLAEVEETENNCKMLFEKLQNVFTKLHNTVKYKIAIPTNVVFPIFIELAEIWKQIQDEAIVLSIYTQIFQVLFKMSRSEKFDIAKIKLMLGDNEVLTDAMRLEKTMGLKIKNQNNLCEVLDPESIKNFHKIPLQFLGFCAWCLVQTDGGLIPGNPNMGICKWKKRYYVFCSLICAEAFGCDPEAFILQALDIARNNPELINLLQLHDQISDLREVNVLYEKPQEVVMTNHIKIQTETHPIKTNIDPNYVWNIWDYYRQAIKLTNISNCKTHSSQTKISYWRYPMFTQTTEPRNVRLQTKCDNYMNTATPQHFIWGLRGRTDDMQHQIDLTRPVDEDYFRKCATAQTNLPTYYMKTKKCKRHVPSVGSSKSNVYKEFVSLKCDKCNSEILKKEKEYDVSVDFSSGELSELLTVRPCTYCFHDDDSKFKF